MNSILQSLRAVEGVHGALVADGGGRIVSFSAESIYDSGLLSKVSRAMVDALDSVRLLHEDWEQVNAQFAEGKLLIRNLAMPGQHQRSTALTLAVIADNRLNPSFATISIRVAVAKLRAIVEAAGTSTGTGIGTSRMATSLPPAPAPSGGQSSSAVFSAADPAASTFLLHCTQTLARTVGPMAKVFVKEAVRKLCPDRPFSKDLAHDLVRELEKTIPEPADAAQFRHLALKGT